MALGGASDLDLPDWNAAFRDDSFDCSPVKHPLAQVTLKDGNTQRVSALGRPIAQVAAAAVLKPTAALAPVAPPAGGNQPERAVFCSENENEPCPASAAAPHSARRAHTPSRTGLTSKPVRLPSRLGLTPGAKQPEQFVVPQSTQATARAAPPPPIAGGGGNLKSILKRLNFSTSKSRSAVAAPAEAPASLLAASQGTMKQLRFDAGATPGAGTAAKPAHLAHPRQVTFDAATVSPAPRLPSLAAASAAACRTPEPTIPEEEEGSGGDDAAGGGSVNSVGAGHTPYDRRLSSLFRRYQAAGTPELDAELEGLVDEGYVRSPSWERLSSASVPESIRGLASKYGGAAQGGGSDAAACSGSPAWPPADAAPLAATPTAAGGESTPVQAADDGSPALDPTPHTVLDSMMKRNAVYESPPAGAVAAAPPAEHQHAAGALDAAGAAGVAAVPPSPAAAVARLLAPVLVATIQQIEREKELAGQAAGSPAARHATNPAQFDGFPRLGQEAATPGARSQVDSVPRNSEGIPTVTPGTVTVRRGGYSSGGLVRGLGGGDDDPAARLFPSFSPDADGGGCGFGFSPDRPAGSEEWAAGEVGPQQEETASPEFSFFPVAAAAPGQPAGVAGTTPELPAPPAGAASSHVSPEILGYYESQAQQQARAPTAGALPRSIIKSGRPLTQAGTPVLGHAQRGGGDAPPTATRELQALMAGLRLEDAAGMEQMGTVSALSPVRATSGRMRGLLGGLARAITPVRRSARKLAQAPARPLEAMLEEAEYSYVPNAALMPGDALARVGEAAAGTPGPPSGPRAPAAAEEAEAAGAAAGRRYSTRSAAEAAGPGSGAGATPGLDEHALEGRRLSLRRLRTPTQRAHATVDEADTPQATLPAAGTPVAQDASPHLRESPGFGDPAAVDSVRSYSLRGSTLKQSRKGLVAAGDAATGATSSGKEQRAGLQPQLSPTEQGIRASLRRSARKSQGPM